MNRTVHVRVVQCHVCFVLGHGGKLWCNILGTPGDCNTFWAQGIAKCLHTTHHTSLICAVSAFPVSYAWQPNVVYTSTHLLYKHCCCAVRHDFIHKTHTLLYSAETEAQIQLRPATQGLSGAGAKWAVV